MLLLIAGGPRALAQTLHLPNSVAAPTLPELTAASSLWALLEAEATALIEREHDLTGIEKIVMRARINVRIIAADMLARGDDEGDAGSTAVLAGLRLAAARLSIDETLEHVLDPSGAAMDPTVRAEARRALTRFNDAALQLVRVPAPRSGEDVDASMRMVLRPLGTAVSRIESAETVSHWPTSVDRSVAPGGPLESITGMRARLAAIALDDDTRAVIGDILDFLDQGMAFDDLRPVVERYQRQMTGVLDFAEVVNEATWIRDEHRATYHASLHRAVVLFRDRQTRSQGESRLARLEHTRVTIRRIESLERQRVDLKPIREALETAEAFLQSPAAQAVGEDRLARLRLVLDRMIDFRELTDPSLKRDLRLASRRLRAAYFDAEGKLVKHINRLTADPTALGDPAFTTLVADQKQTLDDLRRLQSVPTWLDTVALIRPSAKDGIHRQFRKIATWLEDPNRRPEASRALAQFERQLQLFYPLPYETALAQPSDAWLVVTGGRHDHLQQTIHASRRAWADAWARGDASGSDATRMLQLYRLMQTLGNVADITTHDAAGDLLNRWAAWQLPGETVERVIARLQSRLKLATAAANQENSAALTRHLDRIDRELPLAKLMARLTNDLRDELATYPEGAIGAIGQTLNPPGPDAWWGEERERLARLCRYSMELEYATSENNAELAELLSEYTNSLARDLLITLGDSPAPIPTLMGFDGSDPDGDGF